MQSLNYNAEKRKKEARAVITMRNMVRNLADHEKVSYKEALFLFTSSNVYDSLFNFDTGIWKESPEYLLDLYNQIAIKNEKN